jgi:phosphoribosylformimino-5-aminoimidazole carboxamide ribotide isomerase
MIVIPAVDIKSGKCVRLLQGRKEDVTVFSEDPVAMARRWAKDGAEVIHVVDLDGAFEKKPRNLDTIKDIISNVNAAVQVGGGIRDDTTIQAYLEAGAMRVIIGTEAIRDPKWVNAVCRKYSNKIIIGIDARDGMVAIEGWTETTRITAVDLAKKFEDSKVAAINFTDIHRDGMQSGPNIEATRQLAESVKIPIVASGGVSTLKDIQDLLPLSAVGVIGVITGRALYAGTLDLKEAIACTQGQANL